MELRVAFTSNDGVVIDEHFGAAHRFAVWEIGPHTARALDEVRVGAAGVEQEDKIAARAAAVAECAIVCTVQIGGPAAARLVAQRIHPLKTGTPLPISEMVERLQAVLQGSPPPWLRKVMGAPRPEPPTASERDVD